MAAPNDHTSRVSQNKSKNKQKANPKSLVDVEKEKTNKTRRKNVDWIDPDVALHVRRGARIKNRRNKKKDKERKFVKVFKIV